MVSNAISIRKDYLLTGTLMEMPGTRAEEDPPLPEPPVGASVALSQIYRPQPRKWWMLSGIVLVGLILCASIAAILMSRERALTLAERQLQNLAFVLASQATTTFEIIDRVQLSLAEQIATTGIHSAEEFEQKFTNRETHVMLKDKHLGLPHVGAFALVNAEGKIFNFSRSWPVRKIDVSDRAFFKILKADGSRTSFISEPIRKRTTGAWIIPLARTIRTIDGKFAGLLLAAVDVAQFEREFQPIVLGEHGSIALLRDNGVLLARYPRIESMIGHTFHGATGSLGDMESGIVRLIGVMDGKDRILAAQHLERFPFIMTAGLETSAALADWRTEAMTVTAFALFSCCLVALVLILIVRQFSRQDRWSKQRLMIQKERLATAINNMTQGLLLFDASERIVVCNRRYMDMYGLSEQVVKPGCSLLELITHRKETGSFAGDVESYREALLRDLAQGRETELIIETTDGRTVRIVNKPLPSGGWVATHEDITEGKRAQERIAHLAHYDALTDLPNRMMFRERLDEQLAWVHRGAKVAVLYLDLDHFKTINDTLGHPVGDELLVTIAGRLRTCVRDTDLVARLGGDEFAIIQTGIEEPSDVTTLIARVQEAVRQPLDFDGHHVDTDTSIGIAMAPEDGDEADRLLKNADLALYAAKANGRGTYQFFEPRMDARAKARRALEFDLREAIMCGGFELYYQPIVDARLGSVVGYEALLRWMHPVRGMVLPSEFIPLAEETGLINQLGEWVLMTACREAASWPNHIRVAVNVSPIQIKSPGLVLNIVRILAETGLHARRLELEITETVLIRDDDATLSVLHNLRDLGVRIAMDDFGTGFSSLSYLHRFPFDKIKIDRCFIKNLPDDKGAVATIQAIIGIAKARDIVTTGEGVETEEQRKVLSDLGCDQIQGFLISSARPASEIVAMRGGAHLRKVAGRRH
jgi:diguanylate cyclase (GGDEF)-like protein/PAS domain S-box-containing protein